MMFKSSSFNTYNTQSGSSMNESAFAASSFCARLSMDTVIAVSIFVVLGLIISSVIVLAELSVIVLAILSVVIIASVLLAVVIINSNTQRRLNVVKA